MMTSFAGAKASKR